MATSANAQIGSQTQLSYWDTSVTPDAWSDYVNVQQFGEIGADRPEVISTDLDSLLVERIGGLGDGKEISVVCVANTVTAAIIEAQYEASETLDYRMTFPAPLSTSRYFGFAPLGFSYGTITPDGLVTITLRGRMSVGFGSTPTHP